VVENALDRMFDYRVPESLIGSVQLGSRVRVPFGSRRLNAYVVAYPVEPETKRLRDILEVLGPDAFVPPNVLRLAAWLGRYYCASFATALRCVLPEAVRRADARFLQRLWVEPVRMNEEAAEALLKRSKAQRDAWHYLKETGAGWLAELCRDTETSIAVWRGLEAKGLATIESTTQDRDPSARDVILPHAPPELLPEQKAAVALISEKVSARQSKPTLLQGITGSGKTEVYLHAIEHTLKLGLGALVLVPEISLTPQTVERFRARFVGKGVRLAVLHSRLSQGERHDQWHQIQSGRAQLVIGARSAVFAPLLKPGLIVVDEEHEPSYKQEETPHYHARDVAVMRANLENCAVVLGSATPSLESYANAVSGKYDRVQLRLRPTAQGLPTVHLIDMRKAFERGKPPQSLSPRLVEALRLRRERGEQSILFLNRRGFSTSLQCPDCGHLENCPNCSVTLTYHRISQKLRCHLCGHDRPVPTVCPQCKFPNFKHSGQGTEKVEEAVAREVPKAVCVRMDSDSMRGKDSFKKTLQAFAERKTDILVGTQMIAKGLDFPNVTCVGVINPDLALQIPDYRAAERVFQLLMQVAGRAGRGDEVGEVYVQTKLPHHPAVQFARHHDYEGFAEQELEFRQAQGYPPFQRAALVTLRGRNEDKLIYVAEELAKRLLTNLPPGAEMGGPAPAPLAKIDSYYRYHLFFKTNRMPALSEMLWRETGGKDWPDDVRVVVDIDPVHML
jgi:primosomal protein N' (replication factor Y)